MARICNADSLGEALVRYRANAGALRDCKFIFAAGSGPVPGFAVNKNFRAGAAVRSLFSTGRVVVLDAATVKEMESGDAAFPIDYSISLDTQALSYLAPYLADNHARLPGDFQEVFEFIARDDVFVDPLPYLQENLGRLGEPKTLDHVFRTLRAYEVLRTIDLPWLQARGEVRSTLPDSDLDSRAQQLLSRQLYDSQNEALMRELKRGHHFTYIALLKMVAIQLSSGKAPINEKMLKFSEFADQRMATMNARETALARAYFERRQQLAFFGKVQARKQDLIEQLQNMTWDLWHVRSMENALVLKPSAHARFFFPALLTFDKGLIEVIDLYPLKACAFSTLDGQPMPFYDGDWFDLTATDEPGRTYFRERFYSPEAIASRNARRPAASTDLASVVTELEDEVRAAAKI